MPAISVGISQEIIEEAAYELNKRAAVAVPEDAIRAFERARDRETKPMAKYVLTKIVENARVAVAESRPMCGDTGLPRFYVKAGNECVIEGGFVGLERSIRVAEIGWEKRTPKSDKIERRRCQYERCPSRKIHEGIPPGSSEAGNGREAIIAGGSPPVVHGAIDVRVLGEGTKGRQTGRCRQDVQALD